MLALTGGGTFAAFTATSANTGNTAGAGTVRLTDDDAGAALFSLAGQQPNSMVTRCIKVTSEGSLGTRVRMYATGASGALATYASLRVTRGTASSTAPSCTGFTPDASTYQAGLGAGVIYQGTLGAFPAGYAAGISDPSAADPRTWTTGESHAYKIELQVGDNRGAEGKSTSPTFIWDGRDTGGTGGGEQSYSATVAGTPDLLAYWRLGEATGTTASDVTGGHDGTYQFGRTLNEPSLVGTDSDTSVRFDEFSGVVRVSDFADFTGNSPFSAEAWVKPGSANAYRQVQLLWKLSTGGNGWSLDVGNDLISPPNAFQLTRAGGGTFNSVKSTTSGVPGVVRHVVGTYDGMTLRMYVDGILEASSASTVSVGDTTTPVLLGNRTIGDAGLAGGLDDVSLYSRALSAAEVQAHYAAGSQG